MATFAAWTVDMVRRYWQFLLPSILILRFFCRKFFSPLRHYPGPFLASGSRLWKVLCVYEGHFETHQIELHEKYGPIVRTGPNELSFSSPLAARDILAAGKGFHKTDFYWVFPPAGQPDIFTEIREDVHAAKKRHVSKPYSMAAMSDLTPFIESTEKRFLEKLDRMTQSKDQYCNLGDWLHYFAFDVLGEVAFSKNFGFIDGGCDVGNVIKTIDDIQWYDGIVGQIPEWDYFLRRNPLWQYIPGLASKNLKITDMALEELASRQKLGTQQTDRKDLLSQLLAAHEKAPDVFGAGDVFAVAHGAVAAGADSTASTMQSFCHHVLRDAEIYSKLQREIDQAARDGRLSDVPQWSEAHALPYFQACLKEAMRFRPAVGLSIYRRVPAGGAQIDGEFYPGGIEVAVNGWVVHRDTKIFGHGTDKYRPERWIEGDAKTMERYMFNFGGGAHLCIGKNLALLEMNKLLPLLLREYEFKLLRPDEDLKHHSTFFVVQSGLEVKISKRDNM